MQVVRLGERYTTDYQPDELVEGYSSMIFTERFATPGDFELLTPKIDETRLLLPVDTLISHLGTDDVHMVEDHSIELDELDRPVLKVTGRSLDSFVDHRHVEGKYGKKRKMARKYTVSNALSVLLYQAFVNNSGKDLTREGDYTWNTLDRFVNVVITESAASDGSARNRWLVKGPLAPQLAELFTKGDKGLRVIRPHSGSTGMVVTVAVNPIDDRGTLTKTDTSGIMQMRFDIYDGVDKTSTVKFRTMAGDISGVEYLFSDQQTKTAMEVMSSIGIADQYRDNTQKAFTGIRRRVGSIDVGEPDIPDEPQRPKDPRKNASQAEKNQYKDDLTDWREDHEKWQIKRDGIVDEFKDDALDDATGALKDTRTVSMLSGDISPLAPYQFKVDYNLGDKVTLLGDYDETETMVVTEYVRSDDAEGDRGFPGLTMP